MFGFIVNLKRLHDAQQLQPKYKKIAELLEADDVEGALNNLRETPWWQKEGASWRQRVDYDFNNWEKNNPNATQLERDDVLRTFKKMNLRGQGGLEKKVGRTPTAMTTVTDTYNKEISALIKKLKKDLNTDEEGVLNYMKKQQEEFAKKGYNTPQMFGRALDDLILQKFDPQGKKGLSDYANKFKMIRNVEDGVYNDYNSRMRVYRSLMGEGQARNVERRMDMTAEERRDIFPEQTEEFGSFQETRTSETTGITTFPMSDNQPIFVNRPAELAKRKGKGNFNALKLIDELEQPRELAPVDEGGYFMKSSQVILDDPREVYKQPGLLAQINKKGELVGELLNKGVKADEIKESGLLNYLETKQNAGESVTKQELLDFIAENRPNINTITSFRRGAPPDSGIDVPELDNPRNFGWNPEFGVFDNNDIDNANFRVFEPEEVNYDIDEEAYLAFEMMLNPNSGGYEGSGRLRTIQNLLGKLGRDKKILPAKEVKSFIDNNKLDIDNYRDRVKLYNYLDVTEDQMNKALEDVARMSYYSNPEVKWTIPVKTEKGTIEYRVFAKPFTDGFPEYEIEAIFPGEGFLESVATVNNFNDVQVRIANSANNFVGGQGQGSGVDWFKYVQGNTDPGTYREVVIKLNQDGQVVSDIDFHGLAGLPSRETKDMIGHMRIDNRIDKQGRKHTHSGEHQSDWAQQARQYGVTDEEFKNKLANAETANAKAKANIEEYKKIRDEGKLLSEREDFKQSPYISVGADFTDLVSPKSGNVPGSKEGIKLDKPMIDQYINRLKKFVVDEGLDDEVGMYFVSKQDGTPEKRILKKENFLARNIEQFLKPKSVRSLGSDPQIYPSAQEVIERFKNGNPTVMDLKLAYLNAQDIDGHFKSLVNNGNANMQKYGLLGQVFGDDEYYIHNGKEYPLYTLNQTIRRQIYGDINEIKKQTMQKFAESKGVKGSYLDLEQKLQADEERTYNKKEKLKRRGRGIGGTRPALINQDRQTKLMLKELIKQGIKDGSDVVSWTPSQNQIELWGEQNATLFRKTYDKDSLKFGNEILKEYGLDQKVKTEGATIDYGTMKSYSGNTVEQGERDVMYIELTPELKKAVMNEDPNARDFKPSYDAENDKAFRQPLYAVPVGTAPMFQPPIGLLSTSQTSENDGRIDENKGLLQ